jgi:biopolymer transport protein ExbD
MRTLGRGEEDDVLASINIIPFVDIVLVLLVIFMLTSSAIAKASLRVELPRAASAGAAVESTVNLTLLASGQLLVDGEPASAEAAAALVAREARANPKTQAVIAADRGVDYGRVIGLIDLVKKNGITTFALDTQRGVEPVDGPATPVAPTP